MYDIYITLRSVTRGQRGLALLRRAGITARLVRAPREIAPQGCAYALALRAGDLPRAEGALAREGLTWEGIYRRDPAGGFGRLRP